jgi:ribosomal protein S27AE
VENQDRLTCGHCGAVIDMIVGESEREDEIVHCPACSAVVATVGQLHARFAQQALGLGATELRDDHVPVDGELGERPGI